MTALLNRALERSRDVSEETQDAIATRILEELEDEERWARRFGEIQAKLFELAALVRLDIEEGRAHPVSPEGVLKPL